MDRPQESAPKGHARTRSGVKAARPRSATKGPLDDDNPNPLASPLVADQVQRTLSLRSHPRSPNPGPGPGPGPASPAMPRSPARSPAPPVSGKRIPGSVPSPRLGPKEFSFLLRPEIYHPLNPANVPPPFRNPPDPPAADTPIPVLVAQGYFRAAAIAAAHALTNGSLDPTDHAAIFNLFYTRLACLTLIDATPLAAQEVKALGDLHSAFYYASPSPSSQDPSASSSQPQQQQQQQQQHHLIPWPLRVLAVRLQALGFSDPRRAVMSHYDLAREARARLAAARAAHDHSASEAWRARLADLGVRVAAALVDMDDLAGAAVHLRSLRPAAADAGGAGLGLAGSGMDGDAGARVRVMEALLWLQLGDVAAARACCRAVDGEGEGEAGVQERVLGALCDMADGEYEAALGKWAALREEVDDEMVGVNMAVCLLYVGRMQEGRVLLEEMVDAGRSSHTLLFNLSTMYELCTDRSRGLKVRLSEKVALAGDRAGGWEKTNADFKL